MIVKFSVMVAPVDSDTLPTLIRYLNKIECPVHEIRQISVDSTVNTKKARYPKRKVTGRDRAQMHELKLAGRTNEEIAIQLKCSSITVQRHLRRAP